MSRLTRALVLAVALFFAVPTAPATADSVLDLVVSSTESSPSHELHPLDDRELARIQARGPVALPRSMSRARKKVILWDEAHHRDLPKRVPHLTLTPNTARATNHISCRGGR